jgi:hypothetical protein
MDTRRPRRQLTDFDDLEQPSDAAGGFMLADPFDTLLRELSETYLHAAWQRVAAVLERYQLVPEDLSWGTLHGTVYATGFPPPQPADYVGWMSRHLARFDDDPRFGDVRAALESGQPALGCAFALRSDKWRIAPEDARLGVQLVGAVCVGEPSNWAIEFVLRQDIFTDTAPSLDGPWIHMAQAIDQRDQHLLDAALTAAQAAYSPIGYRMMVRGYAAYLQAAGLAGQVQLPDVPD